MSHPKKTVIVVTARGELRFALRVMGRLNVIEAETADAFEKELRAHGAIDVVIVDSRDSAKMAAEAFDILSRARPRLKTITIVERRPREALVNCLYDGAYDRIVYAQDGLIERLLNEIIVMAARKPGPAKGLHRRDGSFAGIVGN